jgi:hypothetical protein
VADRQRRGPAVKAYLFAPAACVFIRWLVHEQAPRCAAWRGQNVDVAGIVNTGTLRSRRQCGWEFVLSNRRQLAHGDSATLEHAKREAEAALRELSS